MPKLNATQIAALKALGLTAAQIKALPAPESAPVAPRRTRSTARSTAALATPAKRTRNAPGSDTWTVRESWKGMEPTAGLLWAARKAKVAPKLMVTCDKYTLSEAIGKARGCKIEVVA